MARAGLGQRMAGHVFGVHAGARLSRRAGGTGRERLGPVRVEVGREGDVQALDGIERELTGRQVRHLEPRQPRHIPQHAHLGVHRLVGGELVVVGVVRVGEVRVEQHQADALVAPHGRQGAQGVGRVVDVDRGDHHAQLVLDAQVAQVVDGGPDEVARITAARHAGEGVGVAGVHGQVEAQVVAHEALGEGTVGERQARRGDVDALALLAQEVHQPEQARVAQDVVGLQVDIAGAGREHELSEARENALLGGLIGGRQVARRLEHGARAEAAVHLAAGVPTLHLDHQQIIRHPEGLQVVVDGASGGLDHGMRPSTSGRLRGGARSGAKAAQRR